MVWCGTCHAADGNDAHWGGTRGTRSECRWSSQGHACERPPCEDVHAMSHPIDPLWQAWPSMRVTASTGHKISKLPSFVLGIPTCAVDAKNVPTVVAGDEVLIQDGAKWVPAAVDAVKGAGKTYAIKPSPGAGEDAPKDKPAAETRPFAAAVFVSHRSVTQQECYDRCLARKKTWKAMTSPGTLIKVVTVLQVRAQRTLRIPLYKDQKPSSEGCVTQSVG